MNKDLLVALILTAGVAASIYRKKLTVTGAVTGGIIGWAVYAGGGFTGLGMLAAFFLLGTAATSDPRESTRHGGQVIANGGVAALTGGLILLVPSEKEYLLVMMAGSLSAATADTLSSELGTKFGRRFINILTWREDQKGLDGVISLEGLMIGITGSTILAVLYMATRGWNSYSFFAIIIAGTVGNLTDSILGAALERRGYLSNDAVNFLGTLAAAATAGLLSCTILPITSTFPPL